MSTNFVDYIIEEDENHCSFRPSPTINIDKFKREFWPGFRARDKEVIGKWIKRLGSPLVRVNLTDNNGNIVEFVPPLAYGIQANSDDIGNKFRQYNGMADSHERAANGMITKYLSNVLQARSAPQSDIDQWTRLLSLFDNESVNNITTESASEEEDIEDW